MADYPANLPGWGVQDPLPDGWPVGQEMQDDQLEASFRRTGRALPRCSSPHGGKQDPEKRPAAEDGPQGEEAYAGHDGGDTGNPHL